jgi:dienelactone hydrolase
VLARDAQTEARWLATLPQVDAKRVGLFGDSQAGWISALAAVREPAVHWLVSVVGPTVTVGETDTWGPLAGQSESPPNGTRAAMLEQVRQAGPSGFDPAPSCASWRFRRSGCTAPTTATCRRSSAWSGSPR